MNKTLIVDASDSDCQLMYGLLTRAGYEPIIAEVKAMSLSDFISLLRPHRALRKSVFREFNQQVN